MWCNRKIDNDKEVLRDLITYFEGTCEFCLANMGIEKYLDDIEVMYANIDAYDIEAKMLIMYVYAVIKYKLEYLDESMSLWKMAEKYAEEINNEEFLAKIYSYYAIYYFVNKEYNLEKIYFSQASEIFLRLKLHTNMALHYINILWYKRYEDDKTEVIEYLNNALYYVKISDSKLDARIYLHIGYILKTIFHDVMNGISFLEIASDMCHRNGNKEMECMTLHTIADSYLQLEHYNDAMNIYERILDGSEYQNITSNLKCMILPNYIYCCFCLSEIDKAKKCMLDLHDLVVYVDQDMQKQIYCIEKLLWAGYYMQAENNITESLKYVEECDNLYQALENGTFLEDFDMRILISYYDLYSLLQEEEKKEKICLRIEEKLDKISLISQQVYYKRQMYSMHEKNDLKREKYYHDLLNKNQSVITNNNLYTQLCNLYECI